MEIYLFNILLSATPYLLLTLVGGLGIFLSRKHHTFPTWKAVVVGVILSFAYGSLQSSNTPKNTAQRQSVPSVEREGKNIERQLPLIEQGKEERAERFEELTNWKKNFKKGE